MVFGFNRNEDINDYRTSEELVHLLMNTVGRGGNLCLNIGPAADGTIPGIMEQRLKDIGGWPAVNGEGIYGTEAWHNPAEKIKESGGAEKKEKSAAEAASTKTGKTVFYTTKGDDLYVLSTQWPAGGLPLPGLNFSKGTAIELLGASAKPSFRNVGKNVRLVPPVVTPVTSKRNYAYVFKVRGGARGLK